MQLEQVRHTFAPGKGYAARRHKRSLCITSSLRKTHAMVHLLSGAL